MELGVPAYLINATLLGVLAQRLVRTFVQALPRATTSNREVLAEMTALAVQRRLSLSSRGCVECRMTGFWAAWACMSC